jgi:hypothetical protein
MKKFLISLVLTTFLFTVPVFSEGREAALGGDQTPVPPTLSQTGSPALIQSITVGIGRRRRRGWRRRAWRRNRRMHNRRWARRHNRRWRRLGLPRRGRIRVRTRYAHTF